MAEALKLREVQIGECGILKFIGDLCVKNKWNYALAYGTLLGAAREGKVIPWDDDVDIIMPREDYEKFRDYCLENANDISPFEIFDPRSTDGYPHNIVRISDSRTILEFDNEIDYGIGLFVDVYPFDEIGNDFQHAVKVLRKARRYASLCFLAGRKHYARDNTRSFVKQLIKLPAYAYAKHKGVSYFKRKIDKLVEQESKPGNLATCLSWAGGTKKEEIYNSSIFQTKPIDFEGLKLMAPADYDSVLRVTYGDNYLTPPPPAERFTHHTYQAYKK